MLKRLMLTAMIVVSTVLFSCANIKSMVNHGTTQTAETAKYILEMRGLTREAFKRVLMLYLHLVEDMRNIADNMCTITELEDKTKTVDFMMSTFVSIGELMRFSISLEDGNAFVKAINDINKVVLETL